MEEDRSIHVRFTSSKVAWRHILPVDGASQSKEQPASPFVLLDQQLKRSAMKESEYITVASRIQVSTAQQILRDICEPNVPEIPAKEYRQVMGYLFDWRVRLEEATSIDED